VGGKKYQNKYRSDSARLRSWDYSQPGSYFVTICTANKQHYFGGIIDKKLNPTDLGKVANDCWVAIPKHFPFVELGAHVVMPNHVHGIITIKPHTGGLVGTQNLASLQPAVIPGIAHSNDKHFPAKNKFGPQSKNLASIVRGYKTGVSTFATMNNLKFEWQERFHDRIIWNDRIYFAVETYIQNNPGKWDTDPQNNF
jgi:putative transposase